MKIFASKNMKQTYNSEEVGVMTKMNVENDLDIFVVMLLIDGFQKNE